MVGSVWSILLDERYAKGGGRAGEGLAQPDTIRARRSL